MKDLEYQSRFVNCFMDHYKQQYELHVFTNLDLLKKSIPQEYAVILTGEYSTEEMTSFVERGEILLDLRENDAGDNRNSTEKYQEVYKIVEQIERLAVSDDKRTAVSQGGIKYKTTGVYSLSQESYQAPFVAMLAKIYGEEEKVLVLDLQSYSGLREEYVSTMGIEDLLSVAITGKYSKGRLLESIQHAPGFDYVGPAQNHCCSAEGTKELFANIVDILARELGYQRFVINFGITFSGQIEMMESCEELYLLTANETWRENAFFKDLNKLEKEELLGNIKRISIPHGVKSDCSVGGLTERWCWGQLGETVKHMIQKEYENGTVM